MKKYNLVKATDKDIPKLIQYKLASILDYDKEITPEETLLKNLFLIKLMIIK